MTHVLNIGYAMTLTQTVHSKENKIIKWQTIMRHAIICNGEYKIKSFFLWNEN